MKLRNFLNFPDSAIACFLKNRGFDYGIDCDDNFVWTYIINVGSTHVAYIIINCDLNHYKLNINRKAYVDGNQINEHNEIDIPKEIIEKDKCGEFIDWLDETCEPYFD